jgi:GNAT superfamily N-acetyltransferase
MSYNPGGDTGGLDRVALHQGISALCDPRYHSWSQNHSGDHSWWWLAIAFNEPTKKTGLFRVVGCVCVELFGPTATQLTKLYVSEPDRRKGIARALLELAWASRRKRVAFLIDEGNAVALHLAAAAGSKVFELWRHKGVIKFGLLCFWAEPLFVVGPQQPPPRLNPRFKLLEFISRDVFIHCVAPFLDLRVEGMHIQQLCKWTPAEWTHLQSRMDHTLPLPELPELYYALQYGEELTKADRLALGQQCLFAPQMLKKLQSQGWVESNSQKNVNKLRQLLAQTKQPPVVTTIIGYLPGLSLRFAEGCRRFADLLISRYAKLIRCGRLLAVEVQSRCRGAGLPFAPEAFLPGKTEEQIKQIFEQRWGKGWESAQDSPIRNSSLHNKIVRIEWA